MTDGEMLPYRSDCSCICHTMPVLHVQACCRPDPAPTDRDEGYARDLIERLVQAADNERDHAQEQDFWHEEILREAARALANRQPDQRGGEVDIITDAMISAGVSASHWPSDFTEKDAREAVNDIVSAALSAAAPRPAEQTGEGVA